MRGISEVSKASERAICVKILTAYCEKQLFCA